MMKRRRRKEKRDKRKRRRRKILPVKKQNSKQEKFIKDHSSQVMKLAYRVKNSQLAWFFCKGKKTDIMLEERILSFKQKLGIEKMRASHYYHYHYSTLPASGFENQGWKAEKPGRFTFDLFLLRTSFHTNSQHPDCPTLPIKAVHRDFLSLLPFITCPSCISIPKGILSAFHNFL